MASFRDRSLSDTPFPYVFLDATYCKARTGGRVASQAVVIATGVSADGRREVLGFDVGDSEDGAFWTSFLRSLKARGLHGVQLVISDAHEGLKGAIASVLLQVSWQRCKVHFLRNVLAKIPKANGEMVLAAIRTIFAQPDEIHVLEQFETIAMMLGRQLPKVGVMLEEAKEDLLAFAAFPFEHWKKIWSTNRPELSASAMSASPIHGAAQRPGRLRIGVGCRFRQPMSLAARAARQPAALGEGRVRAPAGARARVSAA